MRSLNLSVSTADRRLAKPASPPADPALGSMPPETPLDMPSQDLRTGALRAPPRNLQPQAARLLLLAVTLATAALNSAVMWELLSPRGVNLVEWATIAISTVLCAWIAFGFVAATAGFFVALRGRSADLAEPSPVIFTRTAILMPTYNEDPGRVLSAVQAMYEDLRRLGVEELYDVFVLSDTRKPAIAQAEAAGVLRLRMRLGPEAGIYYRRRLLNTDRKAGNIADWVQRWGGAYENMLVLDADSLMTGETIVRMTAAMERDPNLGLLQTTPTIVNAETPFARLHQFASWLYGPIFALGQDWWSGGEGNYWGHNAIIRTRAFAQSAGLPHLSGPPPFGGHIQSHDFVEAALLRRAGWTVRMWATLPGSYEETPPTLLDMAVRDRRWCQGNLQHVRLLGAAGLHWISRLHLFRGVMSYLVAPLWMLLIACGSVVWPSVEASGAASAKLAGVFALTMALLITPKLMGAFLVLRSRGQRIGFGGGARLLVSMTVETIISMITAPVVMVMQATSVVEVLLGRDSGWGAQARDAGDTTARQAWSAHRSHVVLGVAGAIAAAFIDVNLLVWTSPVFIGLALSSVLSLQTARAETGQALQRLRLLQTPSDSLPDGVLARAAELRAGYASEALRLPRLERMMKPHVPGYLITAITAQHVHEVLDFATARERVREAPSHHRRGEAVVVQLDEQVRSHEAHRAAARAPRVEVDGPALPASVAVGRG